MKAITIVALLAATPSLAFEVRMSATAEGNGKPVIVGSTNLPDGTELMVDVRGTRPRAYFGQAKTSVIRGTFRAGPFSHSGDPLDPGTYTMSILMPLPGIQPDSVQAVIGRRGENLQGRLIKKEFAANLVEYTARFKVADTAPMDFRGLKWGSGPTKNLEPVAPASNGLQVWTNKTKPADFYGIPVAEESYSFERRRLFAGGVYIDGESNFARVKEQLTKLYGAPAFANDAKHAYVWRFGRGTSVRLDYQSRFQRTSVTYNNERI